MVPIKRNALNRILMECKWKKIGYENRNTLNRLSYSERVFTRFGKSEYSR